MLTSYTGETGDDFNAFMAQRAGEEEQKAAGNTQDLKGIVDGILAKNVSTMNQ